MIDFKGRNIKRLKALLLEIEEATKLGLGSETPKHWEAALDDILGLIRKAKMEQSP